MHFVINLELFHFRALEYKEQSYQSQIEEFKEERVEVNKDYSEFFIILPLIEGH